MSETTEQKLAAARITVKRALRKKLHEITSDSIAGHILPNDELVAQDHLLDCLQRISFKHNQV